MANHTFEFIDLFAIEEPISLENDDEIQVYLNNKYARYKPYKTNYGYWEMKFKKNIIVNFTKREPSEYSCEEFRNGFYSVGIDGGDWGSSCPSIDFKKACNYCDEFVKKALSYE